MSTFQVLLDSFTNLTGLPTAILDLKGEILAASKWQDICAQFHRKHAAASSRCLESDTALAGALAEGERYTVYKCRNGLVDVAVPITIDNTRVGNLFIGQFLFEPPDPASFARQAEEFGFNKESYLRALSSVPVFPRERIDKAIEFLIHLTTVIGNEGRTKKTLFEANWDLERRVQERTLELTYSHERLRVLSEATFEAIVISENRIITDANKNAAVMFGVGHAIELIGTRLTNFIAPDKREDVEQKILSGYDTPYDSLGLTKAGVVFPIEIHGKTFSFQGRMVRGSAIRDLTEQKKAENEIQALRGILPICSFCKKIRDDKGYWEQVDVYIHRHTEADISHSICPDCLKKHYPEEYPHICLDGGPI